MRLLLEREFPENIIGLERTSENPGDSSFSQHSFFLHKLLLEIDRELIAPHVREVTDGKRSQLGQHVLGLKSRTSERHLNLRLLLEREFPENIIGLIWKERAKVLEILNYFIIFFRSIPFSCTSYY